MAMGEMTMRMSVFGTLGRVGGLVHGGSVCHMLKPLWRKDFFGEIQRLSAANRVCITQIPDCKADLR
jgi:hypothetical protein